MLRNQKTENVLTQTVLVWIAIAVQIVPALLVNSSTVNLDLIKPFKTERLYN